MTHHTLSMSSHVQHVVTCTACHNTYSISPHVLHVVTLRHVVTRAPYVVHTYSISWHIACRHTYTMSSHIQHFVTYSMSSHVHHVVTHSACRHTCMYSILLKAQHVGIRTACHAQSLSSQPHSRCVVTSATSSYRISKCPIVNKSFVSFVVHLGFAFARPRLCQAPPLPGPASARPRLCPAPLLPGPASARPRLCPAPPLPGPASAAHGPASAPAFS